MSPLVIEGGLHGVGKGVIWIPHYPAAAPTWVAACPVAPKKDSLLCKEVTCPGAPSATINYRNPSRLSNIVLGNSLGGRTELLNYERS